MTIKQNWLVVGCKWQLKVMAKYTDTEGLKWLTI